MSALNGLSDDEYVAQLEQEVLAAQAQMQASGSYPSTINPAAMIGGAQKQNLVEWQLDFKTELRDIGRLLRCDVIVKDQRGNESWQPNPDQKLVVFNSIGATDITREIIMFLNKNTVLSNYKADQISERVRQFGHELRMLIYNNYEMYGIDNEYKMHNYPIIVITVLAMVESAYRRALNGEERRDLNSARVVNQNDPMGQAGYPYGLQAPQKRVSGIAKVLPWNWGK